jgi:hypothetical protein
MGGVALKQTPTLLEELNKMIVDDVIPVKAIFDDITPIACVDVKIRYCQDDYNDSENVQELELNTESNGGGIFFEIDTCGGKWGFNDWEEFETTLNDFKRRVGTIERNDNND